MSVFFVFCILKLFLIFLSIVPIKQFDLALRFKDYKIRIQDLNKKLEEKEFKNKEF